MNIFIKMMEQANGKLDVFVYRNNIKIHDVCTIIEWSCFLRKHLSDEMSLTSRKYKVGIAASLDISTENCFHIFLWIIANLLKLIYRNNTFFVCLLQTSKYLLQGIEGIGNIAKGEVESRCIGDWVVSKTAIDGFQSIDHHL